MACSISFMEQTAVDNCSFCVVSVVHYRGINNKVYKNKHMVYAIQAAIVGCMIGGHFESIWLGVGTYFFMLAQKELAEIIVAMIKE